jgi:stage V sporulation protein S
MGPNAVNNAMKAIAIAREYTAADNTDLVCRPEFTHLELDGEQKSAMKLTVFGLDAGK